MAWLLPAAMIWDGNGGAHRSSWIDEEWGRGSIVYACWKEEERWREKFRPQKRWSTKSIVEGLCF